MMKTEIRLNGTYIFEKSGAVVRVLGAITDYGKNVDYCVERVDTGKRMFVSADSLIEDASQHRSHDMQEKKK